MAHFLTCYPTAATALTVLLLLVNLLGRGEAESLFAAAILQCAAQPSSRLQGFLQWLWRPLTLFTGILPMVLCSFVQLGTLYELWSGNLANALLLALSPLLSFLLHLLVLGAGCLLLGLAE